MATAPDEESTATLSPDEAFATVGNETRIQILQALGEAEPLSFSDLFDHVEIDDPGNFNYHLDRLTGHFVRKTNAGYELREPGSIVAQAILSGVITKAPVLEPTQLDAPCPYCEGPVEVSFRGERVLVQCMECPGTYAGSETDVRFLGAHPHGTIAAFRLPPAGLDERTPREVLDAGLARTHNELMVLSKGICPRCSAAVDRSLQCCHEHDFSAGVCPRCNRRRAVSVDYRCTNCIRVEENIPAGLHLMQDPALMSFMSGHGINPVIPSWDDLSPIIGYVEDVRSHDPFRAQFTYSIAGNVLSLTVDKDLTVLDTARGEDN